MPNHLENFISSKITYWTTILGFIGVVMTGAFQAYVFADGQWNQEEQIEYIEDNYATNESVRSVQRQVDIRFLQQQVIQYQDGIAEIKDMEIDGLAKPSHLKKKHRFQDRLIDLKSKIDALGGTVPTFP